MLVAAIEPSLQFCSRYIWYCCSHSSTRTCTPRVHNSAFICLGAPPHDRRFVGHRPHSTSHRPQGLSLHTRAQRSGHMGSGMLSRRSPIPPHSVSTLKNLHPGGSYCPLLVAASCASLCIAILESTGVAHVASSPRVMRTGVRSAGVRWTAPFCCCAASVPKLMPMPSLSITLPTIEDRSLVPSPELAPPVPTPAPPEA